MPNTTTATTATGPTISDINKAFDAVPKLASDGRNYLLWLERVQLATMSLEADNLLTAAPGVDDALLAKRVKLAMFGKMDNGVFMLTKRQADPFELLSFLNSRFNAKTDYVKAEARQKLYGLKCTNDSDILKHLDLLSKHIERVADLGITISDEDYIAIITTSIPTSYRPIVDREQKNVAGKNEMGRLLGSGTWTDLLLSPATILSALRAEALSRPTTKSGKPKSESANSASGGNGKGKGRRGKGRGKSDSGNTTGAKDDTVDASTITCYRCKGIGHKANKCSSPKGVTPKDSANTTQAAKGKGTDTSTSATANTASIVEILSDDELYATSASLRHLSLDNSVIDCSDLGDDDDELYAAAAVVEALATPTDAPSEIYDSGASRHMSPFRELFTTFRTIPTRHIRAANSHNFQAYGIGDVIVEVPNGDKMSKLLLKDTLYAPQMHATLISLGKFDDAGYSIEIKDGYLAVRSRKGKQIAHVRKDSGGLYRVTTTDSAMPASDSLLSLYELHQQLGHISYGYLKKLIASDSLKGINVDPERMKEKECPSCIKAKITRSPIAKFRSSPRALRFGDLFHMDVWGPAKVHTIHQCTYTLTLVDDATHWLEEPLMKSKDESFPKYVAFQTLTKTQHGVTFKVLHSDRGGEFLSNEFTNYLQSEGTERQLTVHDTPEHNGVAERTHRTIFEMVRACMTGTGLPKWLWGEAHQYAVYIFNRTPRASIRFKTPYELHFGNTPDLSHLRPWGALCYAKVAALDKLADRAEEAHYLGPDSTSNGLRIYWPKRRVISIERNVVFSTRATSPIEGEYDIDLPRIDEKLAPSPSPPQSLPDIISEPIDPNIVTGKRVRKPSAKARLIMAGMGLVSQEIEDEEMDEMYVVANLANVASELVTQDPRSMKEALAMPDAEKWKEAMKDEISRLEARDSWTYVYPPKSANVVGSRFVFARKRDANNQVTSYRARLVAQGFSQVEGVDYLYDDTFAPVARMETSRALCALAASKDWEIGQMDVKSAYLYGRMDEGEDIYLRPPQGIQLGNIKPGQVLKLQACLYGLKQAGRRWYKTFRGVMKKVGLTRSNFDHAVFFHLLPNGGLLAIFIHVDDMTLIAPTPTLMTQLKNNVKAEVECVDSGELSWMLGIEIKRDRTARTISFSQHAYIDQILARYHFSDLRPLTTPVDPHVSLDSSQCPTSPSEIDFMRDKPYREALGALMYASVATRPDITFAISTLARFSQNPGPTHWTALKRVFAYLKGMRDFWLTLGGRESKLIGYSDADGMSQESRRPISGYTYLIGGSISWSSKRQDIVTLSTTEAEYVALTHAAKEAIWLQNLLGELFPTGKSPSPITINCDNQGAIALSKDDRFHARTKHIDIRFHFIRNSVETGLIQVQYCPTDDMVADILTKGLPHVKTKHFASLMGLGTV